MKRKKYVKVIGRNGQVTLGKQYAGRTVIIEQVGEGTWIFQTATLVPDTELWMHDEPEKSRIDQAVAWAKEHPPKETDLEELSGLISLRDARSQ